MGKRSTFQRIEGDYYRTPPSAVLPLLPHLEYGDQFIEPCAGNGALRDELERHGMSCVLAVDIQPQAQGIIQSDALQHDFSGTCAEWIITNTPWPKRGGQPAIGFMEHFIQYLPTWALFSADMCHNRYFTRLAPYCAKIVSVGRVSWMDNGQAGKDNAAWYLFDKRNMAQTQFFERIAA